MHRPRVLPACPHLPQPAPLMDYRVLRQHGARRDAGFYESALCYGHHLWLEGHAGRSLLALTRALYADVAENDPVLSSWPLPYAAMRWILAHHDSDDFPGNPRLSFQHQACRLHGVRTEVRSARAWAVWALVCAIRPWLVGDAACPEPEIVAIYMRLQQHGHPGEAERWMETLQSPQNDAIRQFL